MIYYFSLVQLTSHVQLITGSHDAYGDNGWGSNGLKKYGGWGSNAGYGGQHGSHGHNQDYGLYSRLVLNEQNVLITLFRSDTFHDH